MGQPGPVSTPLHVPRRALTTVLVLGLAMVILTLLATGVLGLPTQRGEVAWGTLDLAFPESGQPIPLEGDTATFKAHAHWGGEVEGHAVLMSIEPIPDGWDYSIEGAAPTEGGFRLTGQGTVSVTITVDEDTEPGLYYLEPRLEHPWEVRTLASLRVQVLVTTYDVSLDAVFIEGGPAAPGHRLKGELEVSAPVDRVVEVQLEWAPEGWHISPQRAVVLLGEGSSTPFTFSATVADRAIPGEYAIMWRTRSADPRAVDATFSALISVGAFQALGLETDPWPLVAPVGTTVVAQVALDNPGNVPVHVIAVLPAGEEPLPGGWMVTAEGLPTTVAPFSLLVVPVRVLLPRDPILAPAGEHVIHLRVLTGHSATDLTLTLHVNVPVVRHLGIGVAGAAGTADTVVLDEDAPNEYTVDLVVRDDGNLRGLRQVDLTVEHGLSVESVHLSRRTLLTASGMETVVTMRVQVYPWALPGEHTVTVRASDGSGGEAKVEVVLRVTATVVSLVGDLQVEEVDRTSVVVSCSQEQVFLVSGHVVNDGDDDLAFVKVDLYHGTYGEREHLGYVPIEDLSAGEERTFGIILGIDEPGDHVVEALLTVPGAAPGDPETTRLEHRFEAVPVTPVSAGLPFVFVLAIAVGSLAGLVAILGTEAGRFALMAFIIVPLYTRLKREQVIDHFVRGQILGYVKANPGETYTHIRKALQLSNGQFVYHARILESQGMIVSVKDGANRRFYPEGMRIPPEVKDVELNQVQRIIYTIIMEYPGISQSRISKMVELAPSTVNYHVSIMTRVGVIERRRAGRLSLCFVADEGD